MKKLTAILLIILLLLNTVGYYGIFIGLQHQNNSEMTQRLDSDDYNPAETIVIDVPINLPYGSESPDFYRADGKFEYNGEFYRTLKQRIYRNKLTVVCVKDNESTQIHQALVSYVKTFTDKAADGQSRTKVNLPVSKDYYSETVTVSHSSGGWSTDVAKLSLQRDFESSFYPSILLPPERG